MKRILSLIAVTLLHPLAVRGEPTSTTARASALLESKAQEYVALRRDLHRHPELSDQEVRTARLVADRLEAAGLAVRRGVGGHGVVAILEGGLGGGVVGFRADMDAVTSDWPDPVDFPSVTKGVRHVCGHDVHTAVGVAIAETLAAHKESIPGTLIFIFQGAEETASGAQAMLADDVFGNLDPAVLFALHTGPLPAGTLGVVEGPTLVGRDRLELTLEDEAQKEPLLEALSKTRGDDGRCSLDTRSRGANGLIAQFVFASEKVRQECRETLRQSLKPFQVQVEWTGPISSGVWSTPEVVRRAELAIQRALGEEGAVKSGPAPPMFSEDFGFFLEGRSGALFWLGVGPEGRPHTPGYRVDEAAILSGAKAMVAVLLDALETRQQR